MKTFLINNKITIFIFQLSFEGKSRMNSFVYKFLEVLVMQNGFEIYFGCNILQFQILSVILDWDDRLIPTSVEYLEDIQSKIIYIPEIY